MADTNRLIQEIVKTQCSHHETVMPPFAIPAGFSSDAEYLECLVYTRARAIYGEPIPEDVDDRLQFELDIIKKNGAERYFLFLQNLVSIAEKELGALVGPGRGSTAGSLTAYCLGITKIDPLKQGLLFERFMSPDRQTTPDIDLDLDEEGQTRVLEWFEQKYEKECHEQLKFDFLSLDALSRLKVICAGVRVHHDKDFDIEKIPIDDPKTFKLFQQGNTDGVFQYETAGMQQYLRQLKPTSFEDLVLLNAMYRPGPMENLPLLLRRKQGKIKISYSIPCMEKYLHETYGILVYQEQLMLLSRLIANFSRSESDLLRKALGKRKLDAMAELRLKFVEGGVRNGYKKQTLLKVWEEWVKSGLYAFNKAHAVCYTWLGYQMGYLKANYTEEFLSVMNENDKVSTHSEYI